MFVLSCSAKNLENTATMSKELTFDAVQVGQVVALDCLDSRTLLVKINGYNNCLNLSSWVAGYISPTTVVTLVGKFSLKEI